MASNRFDSRGSRTRSGSRLNLRSTYGNLVHCERNNKKKSNRAYNKAQLRLSTVDFESKTLKWDFT